MSARTVSLAEATHTPEALVQDVDKRQADRGRVPLMTRPRDMTASEPATATLELDGSP